MAEQSQNSSPGQASTTESKTSTRPPPRHATSFPEGHGDFALLSGDHEAVVFHISKFLLGYASPVFSDMFNLGPVSTPETASGDTDASTQSPQVLQVTESARTLDEILRHIDPRQMILPMNELSIGALLEAARKYQLGIIMEWFKAESMKFYEFPNNPIPGKSLMSRNPLLVLALAAEYDMPSLAQQAACAIIGGEATLLQADANMPLKLYRHVSGLRQARIQWYLQLIGTVANKRHRGKPVQPAICTMCSNTRSSWIHELMETVFVAPTWKRFMAEVNSSLRRCKPGCGEWSAQVEEDMMVWSHEAAVLESHLPQLPF